MASHLEKVHKILKLYENAVERSNTLNQVSSEQRQHVVKVVQNITRVTGGISVRIT